MMELLAEECCIQIEIHKWLKAMKALNKQFLKREFDFTHPQNAKVVLQSMNGTNEKIPIWKHHIFDSSLK